MKIGLCLCLGAVMPCKCPRICSWSNPQQTLHSELAHTVEAWEPCHFPVFPQKLYWLPACARASTSLTMKSSNAFSSLLALATKQIFQGRLAIQDQRTESNISCKQAREIGSRENHSNHPQSGPRATTNRTRTQSNIKSYRPMCMPVLLLIGPAKFNVIYLCLQ